MSSFSNVHKGNTVKEHVGFVVLRAKLAARKPNCELIMGLMTRSPKKAEVRVRRGIALCRPYLGSQIVGFCRKIKHANSRWLGSAMQSMQIGFTKIRAIRMC